MWLCGRSVWHTTLGLRGSDTSTAVKFFGALSWASHRMRRPSGAICTDMPSPMPPKPPSRWCDRSLKFQVTTPLAPAGLLAADFAVFALDLVLALAFTLAGFFLAASFFFTRFITHSPLQADQHRDA